jgi:hypothetical protein
MAYLDRLVFGPEEAEKPAKYRNDLLALGLADISGAAPQCEALRAERRAEHEVVAALVSQIALARAGRGMTHFS